MVIEPEQGGRDYALIEELLVGGGVEAEDLSCLLSLLQCKDDWKSQLHALGKDVESLSSVDVSAFESEKSPDRWLPQDICKRLLERMGPLQLRKEFLSMSWPDPPPQWLAPSQVSSLLALHLTEVSVEPLIEALKEESKFFNGYSSEHPIRANLLLACVERCERHTIEVHVDAVHDLDEIAKALTADQEVGLRCSFSGFGGSVETKSLSSTCQTIPSKGFRNALIDVTAICSIDLTVGDRLNDLFENRVEEGFTIEVLRVDKSGLRDVLLVGSLPFAEIWYILHDKDTQPWGPWCTEIRLQQSRGKIYPCLLSSSSQLGLPVQKEGPYFARASLAISYRCCPTARNTDKASVPHLDIQWHGRSIRQPVLREDVHGKDEDETCKWTFSEGNGFEKESLNEGQKTDIEPVRWNFMDFSDTTHGTKERADQYSRSLPINKPSFRHAESVTTSSFYGQPADPVASCSGHVTTEEQEETVKHLMDELHLPGTGFPIARAEAVERVPSDIMTSICEVAKACLELPSKEFKTAASSKGMIEITATPHALICTKPPLIEQKGTEDPGESADCERNHFAYDVLPPTGESASGVYEAVLPDTDATISGKEGQDRVRSHEKESDLEVEDGWTTNELQTIREVNMRSIEALTNLQKQLLSNFLEGTSGEQTNTIHAGKDDEFQNTCMVHDLTIEDSAGHLLPARREDDDHENLAVDVHRSHPLQDNDGLNDEEMLDEPEPAAEETTYEAGNSQDQHVEDLKPVLDDLALCVAKAIQNAGCGVPPEHTVPSRTFAKQLLQEVSTKSRQEVHLGTTQRFELGGRGPLPIDLPRDRIVTSVPSFRDAKLSNGICLRDNKTKASTNANISSKTAAGPCPSAVRRLVTSETFLEDLPPIFATDAEPKSVPQRIQAKTVVEPKAPAALEELNWTPKEKVKGTLPGSSPGYSNATPKRAIDRLARTPLVRPSYQLSPLSTACPSDARSDATRTPSTAFRDETKELRPKQKVRLQTDLDFETRRLARIMRGRADDGSSDSS